MNKEFIIGREGNQPFSIPHKGLPFTSDSVHRQHAKITIDDYGNWTLEDLKGADSNGTFIRDEKSNFIRVYKTRIAEDTIIRLGSEGQHSFTFMAHHVLVNNPEDFSYEFIKLKDCYFQLTNDTEVIKKKIKRQNVMSKYFFPFIGLGISVIPWMFNFDNWLVTRFCFFIPSLVIAPFLNKINEQEKIRSKAERMLVCPKCQRPISKYDINNQLCPNCKAH